jgi:hypothetical protein
MKGLRHNGFIMYGKSFESKYSGSMVGAGAMRFAVLDYVITMQKPSREWGSVVEINPVLLAVIIGEKQADIEEAIGFLCAPDLKSRSKEEGGRRMVKVGEFLYRVVNGAKYRAIRDEEERRTQNREAQRRFVDKKGRRKSMDMPSSAGYKAAEAAAVKGFEDGRLDENFVTKVIDGCHGT